jgi:hypothetical protein
MQTFRQLPLLPSSGETVQNNQFGPLEETNATNSEARVMSCSVQLLVPRPTPKLEHHPRVEIL